MNILLRICALAAAIAPLAAQSPPGRDTIFFTRGEAVVGTALGAEGPIIRFRKPLPAVPGATAPVFATVTVPRVDVARIDFAPDEARDRSLASATPAQLAEVEALWHRMQQWLNIPDSPAGAIGVAYGNLLLRTKDPLNAQKALELFSHIEQNSWRDQDAQDARQGRLRAMIETDNAQGAVAEAMEIARISEDPTVLIHAKFILASAADTALRDLVENNPRWTEDVHVIPERNRLYHEALDLYLFPALFFGSDAGAAARGLWGAAGVYRFAGETSQAVELARDLVAMYPQSPQASQAREFLDDLAPEARAQDNEAEARTEFVPTSQDHEK